MNENFSFEKAYERLEIILEILNKGEVPLEDSLKLFEEADQLIKIAGSKLKSAEKKIEMLIKNRGEDSKLCDYTPPNQHVIS
ncbi:MAG: exodeoxyribonuclease VII small subunit [Simkaniaceae bacterium]